MLDIIQLPSNGILGVLCRGYNLGTDALSGFGGAFLVLSDGGFGLRMLLGDVAGSFLDATPGFAGCSLYLVSGSGARQFLVSDSFAHSLLDLASTLFERSLYGFLVH